MRREFGTPRQSGARLLVLSVLGVVVLTAVISISWVLEYPPSPLTPEPPASSRAPDSGDLGAQTETALQDVAPSRSGLIRRQGARRGTPIQLRLDVDFSGTAQGSSERFADESVSRSRGARATEVIQVAEPRLRWDFRERLGSASSGSSR